MTNALSNPYEIIAGGISAKCSPFGQGYFVSNLDLEKLGEDKQKFLKALFELYEAHQSKELEGIKIYAEKRVKS